MYGTWVNKNVDFKSLTSEIIAFFKKRGFMAEQLDECGKHYIIAKVRGASKVIKITLEGVPENFTIEGIFIEDKPSLFTSTSFFGGGSFLLRDLKEREILLDLEKDFVAYLENTVIKLTNSVVS